MHDQLFKEALLEFEGILPYIGGLYWTLGIARFQINLAETLVPLELVQKIINMWDWIHVPSSDFV